MTTFLYSNTLLGADNATIDCMRGNGSKIVIVPDRFVVSTERKILSRLQLKGSFDIEVLSFTKLARKLLDSKHIKCLTPEGAVLLMRKVINENRSSLKAFSKAAHMSGFAKEIFAALAAVRNNGISVEALRRAEAELPGYLSSKTHDIALLYQGYLEGLRDGHDATTRKEALALEIEHSDYIAESDVYIMEYFSMTRIELAIVEKLMAHAKSFTMGLLKTPDYPSARLYPDGFTSTLRAMASRYGKVTEVYSEERLSEPKRQIERYLYSYAPVEPVSAAGEITLRQANTREEEVEAIAGDIAIAVREGKRYNDLAVMTGDPTEYIPIIERVFTRFHIPYFCDKSYTLSGAPLVRAIADVWNIVYGGRTLQDVLKYLRNPLFGYDGVDQFENYCLKYSITGLYTKQSFTIDDPMLAAAEAVRRELDRIDLPHRHSATVAEYVGDVKEYIRSKDLVRLNDEFRLRQEEIDLPASAITAQVADRLMELLTEIEERLGEERYSHEDFFIMMMSVLDSYELRNIPLIYDCVYVGEGKDSRYLEVKRLYVIGATEGAIPVETGDVGIISEREIKALEKLRLIIEPGAVALNLESKLHLQQTLLKPSEHLTVSYPLSSGGEAMRPSSLIGELKGLYTNLEVEKYDVKDGNYLVRLAATRDQAEKVLSDAVSEYVRRLPRDLRAMDSLAEVLGEAIKNSYRIVSPELGGKEGEFFPKHRTKVSQIESYFRCPYAHYLDYGLKLKERKEGIHEVDTGNFMHRVLEEYISGIGDFGISDAKAEEIARASVEKVLREREFAALTTDVMEVRRRRILKETYALLREITDAGKHSRFAPKYVEKCFGMEGEAPIRLKGTDLDIVGKIDRVDGHGDRVAVIDYKTGIADGSLSEVYCGKKIQLYVYLYALVKNMGYEPFGAFYYAVESDYKRKKERPLRGQYLGSPNLYSDYDDTAVSGTDVSARYLPYDFKKGKPTADTARAMLEESDFETVFEYVDRLVSKAVEEIREGHIGRLPMDDRCDIKCKYYAVCGGATSSRDKPHASMDTIREAVYGGKVD